MSQKIVCGNVWHIALQFWRLNICLWYIMNQYTSLFYWCQWGWNINERLIKVSKEFFEILILLVKMYYRKKEGLRDGSKVSNYWRIWKINQWECWNQGEHRILEQSAWFLVLLVHTAKFYLLHEFKRIRAPVDYGKYSVVVELELKSMCSMDWIQCEGHDTYLMYGRICNTACWNSVPPL